MRHLTTITLLALCLLLTGHAHAQRCLPGMRGIELTADVVDGAPSSGSNDKWGYSFGVAMATYTGSANRWSLGAEFLKRHYRYGQAAIPVSVFTGEAGYSFNFLSNPGKTFFFHAGAAAMAGYETVNRGEKLLYDGATLLNGDAFVYGGALSLELESYLTDRIILLTRFRQRILLGSSISNFHSQAGVGVKFIIH